MLPDRVTSRAARFLSHVVLLMGFLVAASLGRAEQQRAAPGPRALPRPARQDPAPAMDAGVPEGRWEALDGADCGPLWGTFHARFGDGWSVFFDGVTGSPSMLVGPGIPLGAPINADDAGVARARALLEELQDILGLDNPSVFVPERVVAVRSPWGHEIVYINFKQTHLGWDVCHQSRGGSREHLALVKFQFNGTLGRLVLLGSDAVRDLSVPDVARMTEGESLAAALQTLGAAVQVPERTTVRSYVSARGARRFLARDVEVVTSDPPHRYRLIYDAHTGELEESVDDLRGADVIGNVSARTLEYPGATSVTLPARSLYVQVGGGQRRATDQNGDFRIPTPGTSPVTIAGRFDGEWAFVWNAAGSNLSFSQSATPGAPVSIVLPPASGSEQEMAQANAYHWTTKARFYIQSRIPTFVPTYYSGSGWKTGTMVLANMAGPCQAYWNGARIELYLSGWAAPRHCNNSAYADVIAHEYGHAFHQWFHGYPSPAGFSEGIGDHLSLYMTGQRVVGRAFDTFPWPQPMRDYRPGGGANNTQWPCNACLSHQRGEVWAGFTMDLRDNLIQSRPGTGTDIAEQITIAQYACNPSDELAAVAGVYVLDDNDGNLTNGTPDCRDITAAANRHSIPVPPLLSVSCGAVPPARVRDGDFLVAQANQTSGVTQHEIYAVTPSGSVSTFFVPPPTAPWPEPLAIAPWWIQMARDNTGVLVSFATNLYTASGPLPTGLMTIAPGGAAAAYVTNFETDTFRLLDDNRLLIIGAGVPGGPALLNTVFATDENAGGITTLVAGFPGSAYLNSGAENEDNGLWAFSAADWNHNANGYLAEANVSSGMVTRTIASGFRFLRPVDFNRHDGSWYATEPGISSGTVYRITNSGIVTPINRGSNLRGVFSIEVARDGNLIIGNYENILVMDTAGTTLRTLPYQTSSSYFATGVTVYGNNRLQLDTSRGTGAGNTVGVKVAFRGAGHPGQSYVILAALSPRPGIPMPNGEILDLFPDGLTFLVQSGALADIFRNFSGALSGNGEACASVAIPASFPQGSGLRIFLACIAYSGGRMLGISETEAFTIQ